MTGTSSPWELGKVFAGKLGSQRSRWCVGREVSLSRTPGQEGGRGATSQSDLGHKDQGKQAAVFSVEV